MASNQFNLEEILERNKTYASTEHKALPKLSTLLGGDLKGNSPSIILVTCLDPRCPPEALGFAGFDAFCVRNMSGRVKPALVDIASLDSVFNISQVIIMHHSNCGSTHGTADQLRDHLKSTVPGLSSQETDEVIRASPLREDNDSELKADLKTLRECKFIKKDLAEGAVALWLDVETGLARHVTL